MSIPLTDNLILQTYNSLPFKLQEEAWLFMQFLLNQSKNEVPQIASKQAVNGTEKRKRQIGYFPKGTFVLAPDFDAPLDDFKEYMY